MSKALYIGSIIFLIILILVILIFLLKKRRNNYINKIIIKLEKEKNLLINVPVLNELSKVEALVKNNKLQEKYDNWN